jgi:predicted ATP-grasp superfamily ATP-dependent carboligase
VLVVRLGNQHGLELIVARCLVQWRGTQVHLLTADGKSPARYSRHVRSVRCCGPARPEAGWKEILNREAERTRADVVLPVDQKGIRIVTAHRDALPPTAHLPLMPSLTSLDCADDKFALAQLLQALKLPLPRTIRVTRDRDFAKALRTFSFPVLLKPTARAGGEGIRQFNTRGTLVRHVMDGVLGDEPHIVQEFVPGYDLSCNVLCQDGRIVTHTLQRGFLPPTKPFRMPSGVEFFHHDDAIASIRTLAAALNWNGVANIDMRFDEAAGKARILEINPRFWGSLLASAYVGVNFAEAACRFALNLEYPVAEYRLGRFIVENRVALRHVLRTLHLRRASSALLSGSVLSYVATDPLPEIVSVLQQLRCSLVRRR